MFCPHLLNTLAGRILAAGIFVALSYAPVFTQNLNPDSLVKIVNSNLHDTLRIDAGKKLGQYYLESDPVKSLAYFFPALDLAKKSGNHFQEALVLENIGVAYDYKDDMDSCLHYLNLAARYFNSHNMPVDQSHVLNDIAAAWYLRGNYELALRTYFEALELRKKAGIPKFISQSLNNIGIVYKSRKDYANAVKYYKESLVIKEKLNDEPGIFNTLLNIGSLYQARDMFDSAHYFATAALKVAQQLNQARDIALAKTNVGTAMVNLKNFDGEQYLKEAEMFGLANNDRAILVVTHEANGDLALSRKDFKKAIIAYQKGLDLTKNISRREQMVLFYQKLAKSYNLMGDHAKAFRFLQEGQNLADTLLNAENLRQMNELSVVYETSQKAKEIERLNAETRIKDAETRQSKRERNSFILISALLLALAIVAYRAFISNKRKKEQLDVQNQVIETALHEKEILLKEIHHRVKNNLQLVSSLLNLQSYFIKDEMALDAVKDSRNRVQSMALIHQNLYQEENLTGIDVADYINKLTDNLFQSYNIHGNRIKLIKDIQPLNLDIEVVVPLGLILNELITNSLKYGFPGNREGALRISLKEEDALLKIRVHDNGVGLPEDFSSQDNKSFGYNMIRDFLHKMKGEMRVFSEDGAKIEIDIRQYKGVLHE